MSRPAGSGTFDDADVTRAILEARHELRLGDRWPARWQVATRIPVTDAGLRAYHRRRGLGWPAFRALCVPPGTRSRVTDSAA